ncbi:hypothetical protein NEAUS03_1173 [Nematocida ausubeli]|nr:hypothetical protein NEAUS03_1173 [Nematocida ausubeli]
MSMYNGYCSNNSCNENNVDAPYGCVASMHSRNEYELDIVARNLKLLPLQKGSEKARHRLEMMDYCIPRWSALEPGQKIFFIDEELSSRRNSVEKRIYIQFQSYIANFGTPFRNWENTDYDAAIQELLSYIDNEKVSQFVNPPQKGNGSWAHWFNRFLPYVLYTPYSWEEVETEFTKNYNAYPQEFLEAWKFKNKNKDDALKRLYLNCIRIDELARKKKDNAKNKKQNAKSFEKNHKPQMVCKKCSLAENY